MTTRTNRVMDLAYKPLPSAEKLQFYFSYDPATGSLRWQNVPLRAKGSLLGAEAGVVVKNRYVRIMFEKGQFFAHRLIWRIVTGDDPGDLTVDHRDNNGLNNRWSNLRLATAGEQAANRPRFSHKYGAPTAPYPKGVELYFVTDAGEPRFRSRITLRGQVTRLGTFGTAEEAHAAYCAAVERYHGEFARTA
jgi:hypothetical protein